MANQGHNRVLGRHLIQKVLFSEIGLVTTIVLVIGWLSRQNKKIAENVPSPSFDETAQFDIGFYV